MCCLAIILLAFLVMMAGLVFLNYVRKEQLSRSYLIAGWSSVIFAILLIVGLTIGGIVKMACCHKYGKGSCGPKTECPMDKGSCSAYSGATGCESKMKSGCCEGGMRSGEMKCGDMHGSPMEMHKIHKEVIIETDSTHGN
jgi:hypothetical protein